MGFRLWAPAAAQVELVLGEERQAMRPEEHGWWSAAAPAPGPEIDYAFALDGGPPLPDPRSPRQPRGVHGPSRTVDHAAFRWRDAGWQPPPWEQALVYELHIGTFTPGGTFEAAIERLDHLVDLGVTHVELMPVAAFPGRRGWGYDGVCLWAPHEVYGGPEGLKRLVDAGHARGLAVLLDVVYNHLGPSGNYLARFGPYFTDRYATPWGPAINLDGPDSDEVRRFILDNARMWLRDYHLDGLRLDAVHALLDTSAYHLLEELVDEVDRLEEGLGRRLVLVAESDLNDPRLVRSPIAGGYGLDAQWSDDFHHALHTVLTGERAGYYADFGRLADLCVTLERAYLHAGQYSHVRRRRHGRPPTGLGGERFAGYLQNHDQIGNRAQGERISHLVSLGRQKVGAALVLTAPFVPLLFQGEEWGAGTPFLYFTDHEDEALGRAVREGRRREFAAFGWRPEEVPDPQAETTFRRSQLDWSEREREPQAGLLEWHRQLIALRRAQPSLADGRLDHVRATSDEAAGWLRMTRGPVRVAVNLGARRQAVPLGEGTPTRLLLASEPDVLLTGRAVELPPDSVAIVLADAPGEAG